MFLGRARQDPCKNQASAALAYYDNPALKMLSGAWKTKVGLPEVVLDARLRSLGITAEQAGDVSGRRAGAGAPGRGGPHAG